MVERRDVLTGLAKGMAVGVAATVTESKSASANWGMPALKAPFDRRIPFNRARADKVMAEEGVDALVALNPVNVFYCTNLVSYRFKMQASPTPSFAVVPRDAKRPTGLIAVTNDLWDIAAAERAYPELIVAYGGASGWQDIAASGDFGVEPRAIPGARWTTAPATMTPRERDQAALDARHADKLAPTPEWALIHALKELGLTKAKIAVDDMRIARILDWAGLKGVTCVEGDNIFRRIRVVKSEVEIGHMRAAARANQDAAMATMRALKAGMTRADIEVLFMQEAAKRGAKAVWIAAGTTAGLVDPELKPGQSLMIDAVSQINYYHGDFGRTFVLGEPSKALDARTRMMKIGWDAAFAALKPGRKYSEIAAIGREAMKKSGLSEVTVVCGPHSVGLQHTDEPYVRGLPYAVKDDLVLEENMTLTIDFPSQAPGLGHGHLEDLVRITKDGAEALGARDGALVVG
jgi:Xaa-Pro aminopeptidase